MNTQNEDHRDLAPLMDQLSRAAGTADKNDLSGLAKMHGWCEALASATAPEAGCPDPTIHERAVALVGTLESLILGEAQDPDNVVASVREGIAGLTAPPDARSERQGACDKEPASVGVDETDEQIAAKLDELFADDEPRDTPQGSQGSKSEPEAKPVEPDPDPYESTPLKIDPKEQEFVLAFVEEAREHIDAIEVSILEVERSPNDSERINDLFRPFHTIKGMAGFLNLRDVNCLTHEAETILDQGRKGERQIDSGVIDLIFEVVDILKVQVQEVGNYLADPQGDVVPQPPVGQMIDHLRDVNAGRARAGSEQPATDEPSGKTGENLVEQGVVSQKAVDVALDAQVGGSTERKVGEILVDVGAVTRKQVSQAIRPQAKAAKTIDIRSEQSSPTTTGGTRVALDQSVRIDTGKLDALVDMVGELVIAQTLVGANEKVAQDIRLTRDVDQVGKIVREVQEVAMAMRMIPIKTTFQKMARLVRDLSRKAGKKVELTISGEETEVDKNVIQQIGDPLVHMVRNAIDHGIESPAVRLDRGKSETGRVHLSASHQGGNIVIEIRDDGKGLDPAQLVAKAIEKGVIQPSDELTEQQIYGLLFAPGFSTAEKVTDVSGRGVGMDVVKRNIEKLRGKVEIASEKGKGSTFTLRLPLTLAIIDGMVVRLGNERFIMPTISIEQSLRPQPGQITTVQHRGEMIQVRGGLIPLVQLGEMFGACGRVDPCEAIVVVASGNDRQFGLVVEELIGQQQVVIKTLGQRFEKLRGISGAAILGDGRVGLIIEVAGIAAAFDDWQGASVQGAGESSPDKAIATAPGVSEPTEETQAAWEKEQVEAGIDDPTCTNDGDLTSPALV